LRLLSEKSPCISVEQVNILDAAAVHRQMLVMIFLHDSFSSYYIAMFYLNITAETFTESKFLAYSCEKTIWLLFQIMSSQKSELPV